MIRKSLGFEPRSFVLPSLFCSPAPLPLVLKEIIFKVKPYFNKHLLNFSGKLFKF
jgi:hypothetical protein